MCSTILSNIINVSNKDLEKEINNFVIINTTPDINTSDKNITDDVINKSDITIADSIKYKLFDFNNYSLNDDLYMNSLNVVNKSYNINNKIYKLLHYKKSSLTNDNINTIGNFRSVIVDDENNMVMFSPPKSINYNIFYNKYNDVQNKCKVEEIIEGTMINLFYINNKWEISTKTTIGANNSFFKNFDSQIHNVTKPKTFREMFIESCKEVNLDLSLLNKSYNYSFVMQHNENRIVKPIYSIYLYLVKVYKIDNIEKVVYEIDIKKDKLYDILCSTTSIKFPTEYENTETSELSFDELPNRYGSKNTRFDCLGVMIYSPDGNRTKIRNPVYEEIKQLRGNQPKLQYHYLTLKKNKNIKKYLYY
jgi:hypothetical protein